MNVIASWLISKGLKHLSEEVVKQALAVPNTEALLQAEVEKISSKLDILIRAPYKQALMHLREGDPKECKNKLIEAMSVDELDVPARLLYIKLLCLDQKYDLALDLYWDLLESFGFRGDWVPPVLFDAYVKHYFETRIPTSSDEKPLEINEGTDYYPDEVWCSRNAIATHWKRKRILRSDSYAIKVCSWKGNPTLSLPPKGDFRISMLTNRYVMVRDKSSTYSTYRLDNGVQVITPSSEKAHELFLPPASYQTHSHKWRSQEGSLNFLGIKIQKQEKSRTETYRTRAMGINGEGMRMALLHK